MQILFVSQYYYPEIGAASDRITGISRKLVCMGHDVTVLTGFPNYPAGKIYEDYTGRFFAKEKIKGVKLLRAWLFASPNRGLLARGINYITFMLTAMLSVFRLKKIDCVIATSGPIFAALAGYFLSVCKKAPLVLDVRDVWPERIFAAKKMRKGCIYRILEFIEHLLYRKSCQIVGVTQGVCENIIAKGVSREKISLITNGVDPEIFSPGHADERLTKKLNIEKNDFIVIYAGTLGLLQDVKLFIETAEKLLSYKDIRFLIIGDGTKSSMLSSAIREKKLSNILQLSSVSPIELCQYIRLSHLGMNANTKNDHNNMAIPAKIFPYMACAKPFLLANTGEIARLVKEEKIGSCVEPGNAEIFSESILNYYRNRNLCKRHGEKGYDLVCREFVSERLAEKLEKSILRAVRNRWSEK